MNIDPYDYVETDSPTLIFNDDRVQARFELGVCMAIHKWDELSTAVDNQWGGANSNDKRDWLSAVIIDLFKENNAVDNLLIEDALLLAMSEEFNAEVDNDSALEIAALVLKFYRDVTVGNFSDIEQLYSRWQQRQNNRTINKVHIASDPNNPSDDEDEDEDDVDDDHDSPAHYSQPQESMQVDEPIVDDDGFQLVQKKGGRRR